MKMSKHDRKIFNQGRVEGFADGYEKGLHDGNPFILMAEFITDMARRTSEALRDPELVQALAKAREMEEMLEIEGYDFISGDDSSESEDQEE